MTIIIGMKCLGGMVVACDSRTMEPTGHIHDDVLKLHLITFQDGQSAIVAEAGNAHLSSRLIEMVEERAKQIPLNDYRALTTCVEKCSAELKQQIRDQIRGTPEELQRHFESYAFELMIAHYFGGLAYIFKFDFVLGSSQKVNRDYCSLGCGWVLADFIVSRLDIAEEGTGPGVWTAVYAIEEIKKLDSRCGGPTRVALINLENGKSVAAITEDPDVMKATIDEALDYSAEARSEWRLTAARRIDAWIERSRAKKALKQ